MAGILAEVPGAKILSARTEERKFAKRQNRVPKEVVDDWSVVVPVGRTKSVRFPLTLRKREAAAGSPVRLQQSPSISERDRAPQGKAYWYYKRKVYVTTDRELRVDDVLALINEAANTRRLRLEKAHALQAMTQELDAKGRREPIPQDVKITVWQRDGGRCVECGGRENLEFDHIIPLAMGGSNTMRNLQLLCEVCNNRKGATLG